MGNNKDMQNEDIPNVSIGMPDGNGELKPLITTIMPTYRRPKFLGRSIKSVWCLTDVREKQAQVRNFFEGKKLECVVKKMLENMEIEERRIICQF